MRIAKARPRPKNSRGRTVALAAVLILVALGIVAVSLLTENRAPLIPSTDNESSSPGESQDANETIERISVPPRSADATDTLEPDSGESAATESAARRAGAAEDLKPTLDRTIPAVPGGVLTGRVVRDDGRPYREDSVGWPESLRVHVTAPGCRRVCDIDDGGRFECTGLDAGRYEVSMADSFAPYRLPCRGVEVELSLETDSDEVVLVVGRQVPVTVHVLGDLDRRPIKGVSITAECAEGFGAVRCKTDMDGQCELILVSGQYLIRTTRAGDGDTTQLVALKPTDETVTVELFVPSPDAKRMITGVLVDVEGNPVEGYVTFDPMRRSLDVEPASMFAIPAPDDALRQGVIGYARDVSGSLERRFLWTESDPDDEMMIVLEPRASILGRLVDAQRRPISSARLDLQTQMLDGAWRGGDGYLETPAVDEEGYFVFDKVAIGLKLKITAHRGTLSGRSRQIQLTAGQVADAGEIVMMGLRPGVGVVQGRITDESGRLLADRAVNVRVGRSGQWLRTDAEGYYVMTDLPMDRSITITIDVDPYGSWSRTTTPDDFACDFRLCPQGWDVLGKEALPLFAGRWFNHAPMTLKEVRGRVVLLTFRDFAGDRDPGLSQLQNLHSQYGQKGLLIIAAYNHLPQGSSLAEDLVVSHLAASFGGAPIAGFLDGDPAFVADLMAPERPAGATGGATHWLYQVHSRPAFFLIDKAGKVRHCTGNAGRLSGWIESLLDE